MINVHRIYSTASGFGGLEEPYFLKFDIFYVKFLADVRSKTYLCCLQPCKGVREEQGVHFPLYTVIRFPLARREEEFGKMRNFAWAWLRMTFTSKFSVPIRNRLCRPPTTSFPYPHIPPSHHLPHFQHNIHESLIPTAHHCTFPAHDFVP